MKSVKELKDNNTIKYIPFDDFPRKKVDNIEKYVRENGYISLDKLLERVSKRL